MSKAIPKKLEIMGRDYKVKLEDTPTVPRDDEEVPVMGYMHSMKQVIALDKSLTEEMLLSVLIHEALEAVVFRLEIDLPHNYITMLETAVYQLLVDNKKAFIKLLKA